MLRAITSKRDTPLQFCRLRRLQNQFFTVIKLKLSTHTQSTSSRLWSCLFYHLIMSIAITSILRFSRWFTWCCCCCCDPWCWPPPPQHWHWERLTHSLLLSLASVYTSEALSLVTSLNTGLWLAADLSLQPPSAHLSLWRCSSLSPHVSVQDPANTKQSGVISVLNDIRWQNKSRQNITCRC